MPRSSELSDFEKGIIIGYHKCGLSLRDISSYLEYPKSTVAYVIKKWKVSGDYRNEPRVGRPTKLGDRDQRVLSRELRKNRTQPMAVIRKEFQRASGSIVAMNTIRKEAHLQGFHGRAAAHKPLITKSNRATLLMWCKAHRNWTVPIHGKLNADAYCTILDDNVLPTLWQFYGLDPCYFQDDNASCHVSTLTKAWYGANGVHRMDWPAQSPDLNPIENLWDALHRRIQGCTTRPKSVKELLFLLQAEWKKIPLAVIQRLVESMPRSVHAVIASREGSTNY
ncbi:transposable element Tc1 transposase [Caerostris darwini]|uniref:Transposable element Tc1 transposase n=1 Tax=Caerostris darwini TaxID=1538125 RepID=A0AAV4VEE0_9ARAC|nr:transposable element Tc1 transposase [Caerostris darwini]